MNPALLLPVIFGVALLVGAFTGHVTPEQLAAGAALLLVPGADRFAPLLRQLLRPAGGAPAAPGQPGLLALPTEEVHRLAGVAYESYAAATGGKTFDGRPMPTWEEARERIGHAWAAAVTGVIADHASRGALLCGSHHPDRLAPPRPPGGLLLLLLPLLALGCANIERRNAAREVFMQAQEQQTAALRELQTLSAAHQAALLRLPAGPVAVKAVVDFRARRQQTVDLSSKAADAARAAQVELGLRGPPEGLEALARAAGAAAGALADDLAALKRYAAQQLETAGGAP